MNKLKDLAEALHRVFVGNPNAYAEQRENGSYNTVYKPFSIGRIIRMLREDGSCLSYQMAHQRLRWVCFDIDIKSEFLEKDDFHKIKADIQEEVVRMAEKIAKLLRGSEIPYLLEFSGNRGVHIWILWEGWVPRSAGYNLQHLILDKVDACGFTYTTVDRFPPSPKSSARLGKGVKLPLSRHKKSGCYACLVSDKSKFRALFTSPQRELDSKFAHEQLDRLKSFSLPTWDAIAESLQLEKMPKTEPAVDFLRLSDVLVEAGDQSLDSVLDDLRKCKILRDIVDRFRDGDKLPERDRAVMVGLLNRLKTPTDNSFGRNLLSEFFSRQPEFRPSLTKRKLRHLNLYPPTCEYLERSFAENSCPCSAHEDFTVAKSPIELIQGTEIVAEEMFDITERDIDLIRQAQLRYTTKNDEIDLVFTKRRLLDLDATESVYQCRRYLDAVRSLSDYYFFDRSEADGKTRRLVSLSPEDKVLSMPIRLLQNTPICGALC